jgi:hypothetical protein
MNVKSCLKVNNGLLYGTVSIKLEGVRCWQIGMHCSYLMHLFANKSESPLIAPLLDYLLGLQRMSVFALVCVTEGLP